MPDKRKLIWKNSIYRETGNRIHGVRLRTRDSPRFVSFMVKPLLSENLTTRGRLLI